MYGGVINEALASNDVQQIKAMVERVKQTIKDQDNLSTALVELLDAIEKLEKKQ